MPYRHAEDLAVLSRLPALADLSIQIDYGLLDEDGEDDVMANGLGLGAGAQLGVLAVSCEEDMRTTVPLGCLPAYEMMQGGHVCVVHKQLL